MKTDAVIPQLETLKNARDLASACDNIRAGAVFRCSCPYNCSSNDAAVFQQRLGVAHLLDLRTNLEWNADAQHDMLRKATLWMSERTSSGTAEMRLQSNAQAGSSGITVHRISLQEWQRYTRAFVWRLPPHRALPIVFWVLLSRVLGWKHPVQPVRRRVLHECNREGLLGMYITILGAFGPEIGCALRVVAAAAKAQEPIAVFCKLGKDRTGLLCALLLSCCGASDEEIIADYARSTDIPSLAKDPLLKTLKGFDVRLFSAAPPHVMAGTLRHLRRQYSGVPSYLERACGFPRAEQALLAQHLRPV